MDNTRYIIYGTSYCPYCKSSKMILESRRIECVFLSMDEDIKGLEEAKKYYNWNTVPIVLENNKDTGKIKFIGGYTDLMRRVGEIDRVIRN